MPSSKAELDATTGNMYGDGDTYLVTDMFICINEDNMPLAKALFMNIASKDVEVDCVIVGSTGETMEPRPNDDYNVDDI